MAELESIPRTELESMPRIEQESMRGTDPELVPTIELKPMLSAELEPVQKIDLKRMPRTELDLTNSAELESNHKEERQLVPGAELESKFNTEIESKPSFVDFPNEVIMMMAGALLMGWLLASISFRFGAMIRASRRDSHGGRIRSLEAKLRIALAEADKTGKTIKIIKKDLADARAKLRITLADLEKKGNSIGTVEKELAVARADIEKSDDVISDQQESIARLKMDLRYSILKTRELRAEVANRAVENARSEVKLRQLETELGVAQVFTGLSASGVPDYSLEAHTKKERGKPVDQLTRIRPPTIN